MRYYFLAFILILFLFNIILILFNYLNRFYLLYLNSILILLIFYISIKDMLKLLKKIQKSKIFF